VSRVLSNWVNWVVPLILLGLGIVVVVVVRYWIHGGQTPPAEPVGDAVLVALIIMPILVYAIISGILRELKGPGGWAASFNSIATTPVSDALAHSQVLSVGDGDVRIVRPGERRTFRGDIEDLDESLPIAITVTVGNQDYELADIRDSVEYYYRYRSFELVVFLTLDDQFVAFMPAWAAKQVLDDQARNQDFVNAIKSGNRDELYRYSGVVREDLSTKSTVTEALHEMVEHNTRFLVVTDENKRLKGIAEREQVIGRLLLALAQ
jgi:hypothetical protein